MKLRLLIGSLMVLLLSFGIGSCKVKKVLVHQTEIKDSVSVVIERVERDTNIIVPSAKTELEFKITDLEKLPDGAVFNSNNKQAGLQLKKEGDKLKATCDCDTFAIQAKLKDTYTSQDRSRSITNTSPNKEKYVPGWVKMLAWVGGAGIVVIIIVLSIRFYNLRR